MILKIAFRNILRHKRRTILSAITIAFGIAVFIYMDSMLAGIDRMTIDNMISYSTSAMQIHTKEYEKEKNSFPLNYGITSELLGWLQDYLTKNPDVNGFTLRTKFLGQLSNYVESIPVYCIIIDPKTDSSVFRFSGCLKGSYFKQSDFKEIIIGKNLAKELNVDIGDYITLYGLTRYGAHNADEFRIIGLINSPDVVINNNSVFITYNSANELLELENLITEIDVSVKKASNLKLYSNKVRKIQKEIQEKFSSLKVNTFLEIGAGIFEITSAKRIGGFVILLIILIIAVVGIFNTVFMSVCERVREIGVLRAHGMKPSQILNMFLLESIFTGIFGSLLGIFIGAILNFFLVTKGIPIEKLGGKMTTNMLGISGNLYGEWNFLAMIIVALVSVFIAIIAGIIPAIKASKIQVKDALRFN